MTSVRSSVGRGPWPLFPHILSPKNFLMPAMFECRGRDGKMGMFQMSMETVFSILILDRM